MSSEQRPAKRASQTTKQADQARRALLDDFFDDVYKDRRRIYKLNFIRGIFFGLGTFIGGTIVVALVVGVLSWLGNTFHISPFTDIVKVVEETRLNK